MSSCQKHSIVLVWERRLPSLASLGGHVEGFLGGFSYLPLLCRHLGKLAQLVHQLSTVEPLIPVRM